MPHLMLIWIRDNEDYCYVEELRLNTTGPADFTLSISKYRPTIRPLRVIQRYVQKLLIPRKQIFKVCLRVFFLCFIYCTEIYIFW